MQPTAGRFDSCAAPWGPQRRARRRTEALVLPRYAHGLSLRQRRHKSPRFAGALCWAGQGSNLRPWDQKSARNRGNRLFSAETACNDYEATLKQTARSCRVVETSPYSHSYSRLSSDRTTEARSTVCWNSEPSRRPEPRLAAATPANCPAFPNRANRVIKRRDGLCASLAQDRQALARADRLKQAARRSWPDGAWSIARGTPCRSGPTSSPRALERGGWAELCLRTSSHSR